jgi:protein-tyrosine kinase
MSVETIDFDVTGRRRRASEPANARKPEHLLGSLLLAQGVLTEEDIARVLVEQQRGKELFGTTAKRLGLVREEQLVLALSVQYEFPVTLGEIEVGRELFMAHDPFSARAEAIRTLRSELLLRYLGDQRKTIAVVSPTDKEGRSITVANLAIAFAQAGERTLLIDANLRAPRQADLFRVVEGPGLSSLLAGRVSIKDAVFAAEPFNDLAVLCAGPNAPNPQELLGRVTFSYLMESLPATFDVVLVDTPALLPFADAQIIAARAGACLLTTRTNKTRLNELNACKAKLVSAGVDILGVVVND